MFRGIELFIIFILVILLIPVKFAVTEEKTVTKHQELERYFVEYFDGILVINTDYDLYNSYHEFDMLSFNKLYGKSFEKELGKVVTGKSSFGEPTEGSTFVIYGNKIYEKTGDISFEIKYWDILYPINRDEKYLFSMFLSNKYLTLMDYFERYIEEYCGFKEQKIFKWIFLICRLPSIYLCKHFG